MSHIPPGLQVQMATCRTPRSVRAASATADQKPWVPGLASKQGARQQGRRGWTAWGVAVGAMDAVDAVDRPRGLARGLSQVVAAHSGVAHYTGRDQLTLPLHQHRDLHRP